MWLRYVWFAAWCILPFEGIAQPDLYIADDLQDDGSEPTLNLADPFSSPAIWVRQQADPEWSPYPFWGTAPWTIPDHQSAQYFDWRYFNRPCWIYVRITNRGNQPSLGTERLRLYYAIEGPTPLWPAHWQDHWLSDADCPKPILTGEEITKPRINAAYLSEEARKQLVAAMVQLDSLWYPDSVSLWDKQDQIHLVTHVHNTPNFLPWHRELVQRYELLLRWVNPALRLPYWDWTTNPTTSYGVNLFTAQFMGNSQGRCDTPFHHFDAAYDCSKARVGFDFDCQTSFFCIDQPLDFRRPNYVIERAIPDTVPTHIDADSVIVLSCLQAPAGDQFLWFWGGFLKNMSFSLETNHRAAHAFIGKTINCKHSAFQDPFAFLLHANVDKIWALWQRQQGMLERLDPAAMYGNLSSSVFLNESMHPWDGAVYTGLPIQPWLPGSPYVQAKNAFDASVVTPPVYDVAMLSIPPLAPGASVILQVPWYAPDLTYLACAPAFNGNLLLLARIETSMDPPFGMSVPETEDVFQNIVSNNNIAGKRVTLSSVSSIPAAATHRTHRLQVTLAPTIADRQVRLLANRDGPFAITLCDSKGMVRAQQTLITGQIFSVEAFPPGFYNVIVRDLVHHDVDHCMLILHRGQ